MIWVDAIKYPPNDETEVLVTDGSFCNIGKFRGKGKYVYWVTEELNSADVTHWMPLPPLPK